MTTRILRVAIAATIIGMAISCKGSNSHSSHESEKAKIVSQVSGLTDRSASVRVSRQGPRLPKEGVVEVVDGKAIQATFASQNLLILDVETKLVAWGGIRIDGPDTFLWIDAFQGGIYAIDQIYFRFRNPPDASLNLNE